MSYYKEKIRAYGMIREMLPTAKSREEIHLKVANHFGFSKKMVDEYLQTLKESGVGVDI